MTAPHVQVGIGATDQATPVFQELGARIQHWSRESTTAASRFREGFVRASQSVTNLAGDLVGVNNKVANLAQGLLTLGVGGPVTAAVAAGIAVLGVAMRAFGQETSKASKLWDEHLKKLREPQLLAQVGAKLDEQREKVERLTRILERAASMPGFQALVRTQLEAAQTRLSTVERQEREVFTGLQARRPKPKPPEPKPPEPKDLSGVLGRANLPAGLEPTAPGSAEDLRRAVERAAVPEFLRGQRPEGLPPSLGVEAPIEGFEARPGEAGAGAEAEQRLREAAQSAALPAFLAGRRAQGLPEPRAVNRMSEAWAQWRAEIDASLGSLEQMSARVLPGVVEGFGAMAEALVAGQGAMQGLAKAALKPVVEEARGYGRLSIAKGAIKVKEGIWPPNPAAIASGLGMMAAGASLLAIAGQLGGGGGGGGAAGTSGGVAGAPRGGDETERLANGVRRLAAEGGSTLTVIWPRDAFAQPGDPKFQELISRTYQLALERRVTTIRPIAV
jgi:hypothetical protein